MEAGWITKTPIDNQSVERLGDLLQVTIDEHARMYDLGQPSIPAVREMGYFSHLMDPDQFVETGFKLINNEDGVKRTLNSSPLQNLVIETRNDRDVFVYRRFT